MATAVYRIYSSGAPMTPMYTFTRQTEGLSPGHRPELLPAKKQVLGVEIQALRCASSLDDLARRGACCGVTLWPQMAWKHLFFIGYDMKLIFPCLHWVNLWKISCKHICLWLIHFAFSIPQLENRSPTNFCAPKMEVDQGKLSDLRDTGLIFFKTKRRG